MYSYVGGLLCGNILRVSIDVGWWLSLAWHVTEHPSVTSDGTLIEDRGWTQRQQD